MADAKISELPVLATPESIDKLLIVDTSESTTKHITYGNLVSALQGANVTLAALGDVNTTGLSNGNVLKYNSAANEWQPGSDTAGILYTDLSAINATASGGGSLAFNNVTGVFTNTPPDLSGFITASSSDTLTNKSGNISMFTNNSGYITASSTDTLTNKGGNVSMFTNDANYLTTTSTSTLTNKTIDADGTGNDITNIEDANIKASAAIDATKIADGTVTNTEFQHLNTVTGNVQTQINAKADTSSLAASATTDTTNASNIGSGTLNKARLPASIDADTTGNAATATLATTATTPVNLPSTTLGAIGTYAFAYPFDSGAGTNVYAIAVGGTVDGDKLWYYTGTLSTSDLGPGYHGAFAEPRTSSGLNPGDTGGLSNWAQIASSGSSLWRNMGPQQAISYDPTGSNWYKVPALFVRVS